MLMSMQGENTFLPPLKGNLDTFLYDMQFLHVANASAVKIPSHLPDDVNRCFQEGVDCMSIGCFNAAGAMFRLALDIATKGLLAQNTWSVEPNRDQRSKLAFRLDFLFSQGVLDAGMRELADSVRHDGNDGAHDGSLTRADAEDLIDFSRLLLERIYTEPARLEAARRRRAERREN